jgi:hypothetical protein
MLEVRKSKSITSALELAEQTPEARKNGTILMQFNQSQDELKFNTVEDENATGTNRRRSISMRNLYSNPTS